MASQAARIDSKTPAGTVWAVAMGAATVAVRAAVATAAVATAAVRVAVRVAAVRAAAAMVVVTAVATVGVVTVVVATAAAVTAAAATAVVTVAVATVAAMVDCQSYHLRSSARRNAGLRGSSRSSRCCRLSPQLVGCPPLRERTPPMSIRWLHLIHIPYQPPPSAQYVCRVEHQLTCTDQELAAMLPAPDNRSYPKRRKRHIQERSPIQAECSSLLSWLETGSAVVMAAATVAATVAATAAEVMVVAATAVVMAVVTAAAAMAVVTVAVATVAATVERRSSRLRSSGPRAVRSPCHTHTP